ncbi:MAG: hypothetical protein DHS20C18_45540 [Saprospiraceae bacterium]|nr:MAG: hypothetical protein DHS20C18_45540 [Saprospiraceae bacterium]
MAQLQDDFSDGELSNNPEWLGHTERFTVTNGELQLFDPVPLSNNETFLSLSAPTSSESTTAWEFFVRLEFSPSSTNFVRVYLNASQQDLLGDLNGYYLKVGGVSQDVDALELYRQDGSSSTLLIAGSTGAVGMDPAIARVKISRTTNGTWQLMADYSGGTNFVDEGSAIDATYPMGDFFGFYCVYTISRSENFFFDDVRIDPIFEDTTPPILNAGNALSATEISLQFNEPLASASAENTSNYSINNGIGTPVSAEIDAQNPSRVLLTLGSSMVNQIDYTVSASNVADLNNNVAGVQNIEFTYLNIQGAEAGDLIITEIMADPNPVVGLPDAEYLELYNASDKVLQLENIGLSTGSTPRLLPDYMLFPGEYVSICPESFLAEFTAIGPAIGLSSFPALTNTGDEVTLTDPNGLTLASLVYDLSWFQDNDKDDGGWSLELIQLERPYNCAGNWRASEGQLGGTPGQQNSLFGQSIDTNGPKIVGINTDGPETILIEFDKALDMETAETIGYYQIEGGIGIMEALLIEPERNQVMLTLNNALNLNQIYTLTFDPAISDCLGNLLGSNQSVNFAYTLVPEANSAIVTEIMADPDPTVGLPRAEYIEIYNHSDQLIQLSDLIFSNGSVLKVLPFYLLEPGKYVVLCDELDVSTFNLFGPAVGIEDFPGLVNSTDDIILTNRAGNPIFSLLYTLDWYEDIEKDDGGWSLELIDLDGPYDCGGNWRASENINGGTPGQVNSLFGKTPDETGPDLLRVYTLDSMQLVAVFNEPLDATEAKNIANYSLDNGISVFTATFLPDLDGKRVALDLDSPLNPNIIYTLNVDNRVKDCMGNNLSEKNTARFGLPEVAAANDVVINEILFNPEVGGRDFVEFFNRSEKVIDLFNFRIGNFHLETANPTVKLEDHFQLFPEEYVVITTDPSLIQSQYTVENERNLWAGPLPSLPDNEGNISLISPAPDSIIIDSFFYTDDLHFPLLSDKGGVSLERLNPDKPTQNSGNWHSAAASAGYATPTAKNSQFFITEAAPENEIITLGNATFSPDEDGFEDVLQINYFTDRPGFSLKLDVYDAQGRLIQRLVRNELLNTGNGTFKWDGLDLEGQKARVGIYIIAGEVINPDGEVEQFKESCVLATRF